jgi:GDPmannose 4,6-dehydratase
VESAARVLGITLRFEGIDQSEVGVVDTVVGDAAVSPGETIVRVDPRYFRPAEVETLLGDPSKAEAELGWKAATSFDELVEEMALADLALARREQQTGGISMKLGRIEEHTRS